MQRPAFWLGARFLFAFSTLSISGCAHVNSRFGTIPPTPNLTTSALKDCFAFDTPANFPSTATPDKNKQIRNLQINQWIVAIRASHDVYNGRVSQHRANFDAVSDTATLASAAISAINPGVVIGATTTALTGFKAAVDKDLYNDLSRTALLLDLYKNADTNEAIVKSHINDDYSAYGMSDACRDLDAFYRSGSAIQAVSAAGATPTNPPSQVSPTTPKVSNGVTPGGSSTPTTPITPTPPTAPVAPTTPNAPTSPSSS